MRRRTLLLLVATYGAVHAAYVLLGVRFDLAPLGGSWQFLDVELLRHDLLRSLFCLHSQPPGFNFFLGIVVLARRRRGADRWIRFEVNGFYTVLLGLLASRLWDRVKAKLKDSSATGSGCAA